MKEDAAVAIQSVYRSKAARKKVERRKRVKHTDSVVAAGIDPKNEIAVTKLQARVRGSHARKRVNRIKSRRVHVHKTVAKGVDPRDERAITKLQARQRGRRGRRRVAKLRQEKAKRQATEGSSAGKSLSDAVAGDDNTAGLADKRPGDDRSHKELSEEGRAELERVSGTKIQGLFRMRHAKVAVEGERRKQQRQAAVRALAEACRKVGELEASDYDDMFSSIRSDPHQRTTAIAVFRSTFALVNEEFVWRDARARISDAAFHKRVLLTKPRDVSPEVAADLVRAVVGHNLDTVAHTMVGTNVGLAAWARYVACISDAVFAFADDAVRAKLSAVVGEKTRARRGESLVRQDSLRFLRRTNSRGSDHSWGSSPSPVKRPSEREPL